MATLVPQKDDVEHWTVEQVAAWLQQVSSTRSCIHQTLDLVVMIKVVMMRVVNLFISSVFYLMSFKNSSLYNICIFICIICIIYLYFYSIFFFFNLLPMAPVGLMEAINGQPPLVSRTG